MEKKHFFDFLSAIDLLTYLEYIWIFPLEKLKKLRIFPPIHQFPTWRGGTTVHSHGAGGERGGGVLKLEKNFFAFLDVLDHLEAKKNEKEKSWKMTLLRPPPLQVGNFQLFFRFF